MTPEQAGIDLREKLSRVPDKPGVYLFRDGKKRILYVGKAKGLRNRLRSYFQKSSTLDQRKTAMMEVIRDFEYTVTSNELEAFVLEANLIKQYKPRYNVLLRDDKSYPYLKLTVNEEWPRLEVVRKIMKDGARYFGPYVPSGPMWNILSFIRNNFPLRTCSSPPEKRKRPCIQYQIKKCTAPCSGSLDHDEYMKMVHEVRLLLEGKNRGLLEALSKKMKILSEEMLYEEAALVRDRIEAIRKISESQKAVAPELGDADVIGIFRDGGTAVFKLLFIRNGLMIGSRHFVVSSLTDESEAYLLKSMVGQFYGKEVIPPADILFGAEPEDAALLTSWLSEKRGERVTLAVPKRGLKRKLVAMAEENARILLRSELEGRKMEVMEETAAFLHLEDTPADIGAFDISNIAGSEPVGSFVYWHAGGFRKEKYRHIKMDAVKGPDDYAMMKEMVRRTMKNLEGRLADLVIIDGGRAHLDAAMEAFREAGGADFAVVGVAKDPDRVFLPDTDNPLSLEGGGGAALLLRRIRDEAHRFALSYHKKLRSRRVFASRLEKIPGVGKKRRFALLRHFGSIEAIRNASVEEIASLKGFNRTIAGKISGSLAGGNKE